jgi:hypothetical protein
VTWWLRSNWLNASPSPARAKNWSKALQWNSVEIVSKEGQVRAYLNGTLISAVTQHDFIRAGHIGFQSEGAEIYFRNIRIREE